MVTLQLLEQCKNDDRKAHYELYHASFACLYKVCKRYYKNDADVKSALNMVFLKVVTHLNVFTDKSKPIEVYEIWLKRIAINHIVDEFRAHKKYKAAMIPTADFSIFDSTPKFAENVAEDLQAIHQAIEKLPKMARTIFTMYTIDGYKHKEIAELLDIKESTSKVHFRLAKLKIRQLLFSKTATRVAYFGLILIDGFKK